MRFSIQRSKVTKENILNPSSAFLPQLAPPSLSHSFLRCRSQPSCRPSKPPYRNSAAGSGPKHLQRVYSSSVAPRTRLASPDPLGNSTSAIRQTKWKRENGVGIYYFPADKASQAQTPGPTRRSGSSGSLTSSRARLCVHAAIISFLHPPNLLRL